MIAKKEAKLLLLEKRLLTYSDTLIQEMNDEIKRAIEKDKNKVIIELKKNMSSSLRSSLFEYIELHGYRTHKNPDYVIEGKHKRLTQTDEYTEVEIIW